MQTITYEVYGKIKVPLIQDICSLTCYCTLYPAELRNE